MRSHRGHNKTISEAQPLVAEEPPFAATADLEVGSSLSVAAAEKGSVYAAGRTAHHERRVTEGKLPRYDDLFENTAAGEPSLISGDDGPQMSRNSISRWMRRVSRECFFSAAGVRERVTE